MVHHHRASLLLHHDQQQSKGGGRATLLLMLAAFAFVSCLLLLLPNGPAFSAAMDDLLQQLGTMRRRVPRCPTASSVATALRNAPTSASCAETSARCERG
jgi:hypothetical protein